MRFTGVDAFIRSNTICLLRPPVISEAMRILARGKRQDFGFAAKSDRSIRKEMARPQINPQKAAPTFSSG